MTSDISSALQRAHEAVQDRKAATGMPDIEAILATGEEPPLAGEHAGMFAGTDLTEADAFALAVFIARGAAAMIVVGGTDVMQALVSSFVEGLMTGVEYGKAIR